MNNVRVCQPAPPTRLYLTLNQGAGPRAISLSWVTLMAQQRQRQRLSALRDDPNLARFVLEGTATGKQLGNGSYGSVEEVSLRKVP